jgi:hypothetical protein
MSDLTDMDMIDFSVVISLGGIGISPRGARKQTGEKAISSSTTINGRLLRVTIPPTSFAALAARMRVFCVTLGIDNECIAMR